MDSSSPFRQSLLSSLPTLPITPGIYIFKKGDSVLYVGKAKNLRQRVSSYFQSPYKLGPKTTALIKKIETIDHIKVNSEIEALLLESRLINKFKPQYNIISKDDKSPYYIHITKEIFPRPLINHAPNGAVAGPFLNRLIPSKILKQFRRISPFCISPRPVKKPCFYSHLGLCNPCPGKATDPKSYGQNITRLKRLLSGHFFWVTNNLKKEMVKASSLQDYEKAASLRDNLQALQFLLSSPTNPEEYLINPNLVEDRQNEALSSLYSHLLPYIPQLNFPSRIEAYDISHISGQSATASMVVSHKGELTSNLYRHFKIRFSPTDSDVHMMAEVLSRRLHRSDWPMPDLIVLDGGKSQLSILKSMSHTHPPVIALAKPSETVVIPLADGFQEINFPQNDSSLQLLMRLRNEAHRFARRLHHQTRAKIIFRT